MRPPLVSFSVIKCLAAFLTLFRLRLRLKLQRFWWEDTWAAVALLCTVTSVGAVLVALETSEYFWSHKPDTYVLTIRSQMMMNQLSSLIRLMHTCLSVSYGMYIRIPYNALRDISMMLFITRFVRMSLMFSIIRIAYPDHLRRIALAVAACFFLCWATSLGLQAWWCVDNTRMLLGQAAHCVLPRSIIIFQATSTYFNKPRPQLPIYFCAS